MPLDICYKNSIKGTICCLTDSYLYYVFRICEVSYPSFKCEYEAGPLQNTDLPSLYTVIQYFLHRSPITVPLITMCTHIKILGNWHRIQISEPLYELRPALVSHCFLGCGIDD